MNDQNLIMIDKVEEGEEGIKVYLMDGSVYWVNPSDSDIALLWYGSQNVSIHRNEKHDFNYTITNIKTGQEIFAMKL